MPMNLRHDVMKTPLARIRTGALLLLSITILSVCAYKFFGDRSWVDAIYMVVITISSVGYTESSKMSAGNQLLTVTVIIFGMSAAMYTIGGFLQLMTEGEIEHALGIRRTKRKINKMKNHCVICGFGRTGKMIAQEMKIYGKSIIVIDSDQKLAVVASEDNFLFLDGDASEEDVLLRANIEQADSLVCALPNDAANVFITLTARNLNPNIKIVARGEYESSQKKLFQAGADRVVMPSIIAARRMAAMLIRPSMVELMDLVTTKTELDVEIDELTINEGSGLVGCTVVEAEARRKHGIMIMAVKHVNEKLVFNPDSTVSFAAGDILIVMGNSNDVSRFKESYQL